MKSRIAKNLSLYKINDIIATEFIRLPLALLAGKNYRKMSLEAKIIYSLLINRLTLSQRNGWINDHGEVYLIYTRAETANTLGITYKKAISAFKELLAADLILEQRRGRGFPNIIYLVKTKLSEEDAHEFGEYFHTPETQPERNTSYEQDGNFQMHQNELSVYNDLTEQDVAFRQVMTCQNDISKTSKSAVQNMPKLHTRKTDIKKTYTNQLENSQTVRQERSRAAPGTTNRSTNADDIQILEILYRQCDFDIWEDKNIVTMFKSAIERLYFSENFKIGRAILPRTRVRSFLWLLDAEVITQTYEALKQNRNSVRNVTGFVMSTLYNTICERESHLLVNLPPEYLSSPDD